MKSAEKSSIKHKERIKYLVDIINRYSHEYYVLDAPTVSDDEWDALYRELVDLEKETGFILPESPTQKVGGGGSAIKSGFKKHKHIFQLLSLDKSQSIDEVEKWFDGIKAKFPAAEFTAGYKFDGVRLVLTYEGGKLLKAATRGDGKVGEDVTSQVKTIESIPHQINCTEKMEIGGEGMMKKSNLTDEFKNTRNAAAGAIRNIDPKVTARHKLDFFAYALNFADGRQINTSTALQNLASFGFPITTPKKWKGIKTFAQLESIVEEITAERTNLDFDIDGIVISVEDHVIRAELGSTIKFPRWSMAYKFEAEVVTTKLLNIVWQVGRSGKVTPVAILEPVELCGASVSRATLNNYGDILRKGVKIGEDVTIRRSNDVIPEILGAVAKGQSNIVDIDICPSCGIVLETVGANKFCKNKNCPARILEKFMHFVSRDCMNIEGLSEKTLESLIQKGSVSLLGDIYRITEKHLSMLEGFKDKKINNLLEAIEKSKTVDFARFIHSLGIPNIGKKASATLANSINNFDNLNLDQLVCLDEFGEIMAASVIEYFQTNRMEVDDLLGCVQIQHKKSEGILKGQKICITGTLEQYTRLNLSKTLEELGASVVDAVSKTTDVLIVGQNAGSKLEKAQKFGVKIVEENRLSDYLVDGKIN